VLFICATRLRKTFTLSQYNNHFYNLATIIVERVSGIPFFEFARDHLFRAIGFKHTTFYSSEIKASGRVSEGFWRHGETNSSKGTIQTTEVWDKLDLRATGAGCVLASGDDVVRIPSSDQTKFLTASIGSVASDAAESWQEPANGQAGHPRRGPGQDLVGDIGDGARTSDRP